MSRIGSPGTFTFTVVRRIGAGGLGTVDEIRVTESFDSHPLGSRFAMKKLGEAWAAHPHARARFEQEIAALQTMAHPNIISFQGENLPDNPERFYVMPLCQQSFRDVLQTNGERGFAWESVATLGAQLADALAYAHGFGFIHRDLKPENLLVDLLNNPLIADWGVGYFIHQQSKVLDHALADHLGTKYYCSREQWFTGKCGPSGDVYALGMTLAEFVMGARVNLPRVGAGILHDVAPAISPGARFFNNLIRRMTASHDRTRIQDMLHAAQGLRQAVAVQRQQYI